MSTSAKLGLGTALKIGNGASPEVFTTIEEIIDQIEGPQEEAPQVDATHMQSTKRDYIAGIPDAGRLRFKMNARPTATGQAAVYTSFNAGSTVNYQLVFPSGITRTGAFAAIVLRHAQSFPVNGVITVDVELQISGAITWS